MTNPGGDTRLAEVSRGIERLEERVHVACRALVLQAHVPGFLLRVVATAGARRISIRDETHENRTEHALDKVMPQHAGRVLEHANKDGDFCGLVLDRRTRVALLDGEELAKLAETREAPVALFRDEPMMCVYHTFEPS